MTKERFYCMHCHYAFLRKEMPKMCPMCASSQIVEFKPKTTAELLQES